MFIEEKIRCKSKEYMNVTNGLVHYTFGKGSEDMLPEDLLSIPRGSFDWLVEDGIKQVLMRSFPFNCKGNTISCLSYTLGRPAQDINTCIQKKQTYAAPLKLQLAINEEDNKELITIGEIPYLTDEASFIINGQERTIVNQIVLNSGVYFTERKLSAMIEEKPSEEAEEPSTRNRLPEDSSGARTEQSATDVVDDEEAEADTSSDSEDIQPEEEESPSDKTSCEIRTAYNQTICLSYNHKDKQFSLEVKKKNVSLKSFLDFLNIDEAEVREYIDIDAKTLGQYKEAHKNKLQKFLDQGSLDIQGRKALNNRYSWRRVLQASGLFGDTLERVSFYEDFVAIIKSTPDIYYIEENGLGIVYKPSQPEKRYYYLLPDRIQDQLLLYYLSVLWETYQEEAQEPKLFLHLGEPCLLTADSDKQPSINLGQYFKAAKAYPQHEINQLPKGLYVHTSQANLPYAQKLRENLDLAKARDYFWSTVIKGYILNEPLQLKDKLLYDKGTEVTDSVITELEKVGLYSQLGKGSLHCLKDGKEITLHFLTGKPDFYFKKDRNGAYCYDTYRSLQITRADLRLAFFDFLKLIQNPTPQRDMDDLCHRRIRRLGDQIADVISKGLKLIFSNIRYSKAATEKTNDLHKKLRDYFKNSLTFQAPINSYFGSDSLCQFVDQTNPLASLSHKRTVSSLGNGGLNARFAGVTVRDAHKSFYGRLCPIETPEGQNIGLINHIALYGSINRDGILGTSYLKIKKDRKPYYVTYTDDPITLYPEVDDQNYIVQAEELDAQGIINNTSVQAHMRGELAVIDIDKASYVDISPKQILGASASLVPFLAHDDARRALMACNMMRQSFSCGTSLASAPIISTGMELKLAVDGGGCLLAKQAGKVVKANSTSIDILEYFHDQHTTELKASDNSRIITYQLPKLQPSNKKNLISYRPAVNKGDIVSKGQVLADSTATQQGELALGQNIIVAYMPWEGYNFEDAILVSEELVSSERFSSVYIEQFDCDICEDYAIKDTVSFIVEIGTRVYPGDILVNKETLYKKDNTTKKTFLRLKGNKEGIVVDVKTIFNDNKRSIGDTALQRITVTVAQRRQLAVGDKMAGRHGNKGVISKILPREDMPYMANGQPVDIVLNPLGVPSRMNMGQLLEAHLGWTARALGIELDIENIKAALLANNQVKLHEIDENTEHSQQPKDYSCISEYELYNTYAKYKLDKPTKAEQEKYAEFLKIKEAELLKSKLAKKLKRFNYSLDKYGCPKPRTVYQYKKYNNSLFDEKALPICVPPFEDASLQDIKELFRLSLYDVDNTIYIDCTNGSTSITAEYKEKNYSLEPDKSSNSLILRLTPEQVYSLCLKTGILVLATNYTKIDLDFSQAENSMPKHILIDCLDKHLRLIDLATKEIVFEDGKIALYDGRTGERFTELVTVGLTYFLKLNHMAADKVHARAQGPYSSETLQPLQGAARGGGMRVGEMEAFALEAYGAKHNLREMHSTKSDNKNDRESMYSIISKQYEEIPTLEYAPTEALSNLFASFYGLGLLPAYEDDNGNTNYFYYQDEEISDDLLEQLADEDDLEETLDDGDEEA